MAIRNDYLQDMIMRFVEVLTQAAGGDRPGGAVEVRRGCESVVGDVLDMDAPTVLALSPASLVTMLQISAVDDRLAAYLAYALRRLAELDEAAGDATAQVRRAQAAAVEAAFRLDPGAVPPELQTPPE